MQHPLPRTLTTFVALAVALVITGSATARDMSDIMKKGVLRHQGIPHANFVTGSGVGISDGTNDRIVKNYYPTAHFYFPDHCKK